MLLETLTPEQLAFLQSRDYDRQTVAVNYLMGLDLHILKEYEAIYKAHIAEDFVLTPWCDSCCFNMVRRIFEKFSPALEEARVAALPKYEDQEQGHVVENMTVLSQTGGEGSTVPPEGERPATDNGGGTTRRRKTNQ